jgi:hypothetical protein
MSWNNKEEGGWRYFETNIEGVAETRTTISYE